VLRWNGKVWSSVSTNIGEQLVGVWTSGPRDIRLAGAGHSFRGDGSSWNLWGGPFYANDVWGSGPADAWIVGSNGLLHFVTH
jgi:hypothetical protein